ncbi:MAG: hypothetical protein ACRD1S_02055 [Vicinamibacterales bacterium]
MPKTLGRIILFGLLLMLAATTGPVVALGAAGDVAVTVTYKGKGPVDETREVWVFLFDTPDLGPGARPVATQTVKKNGGTATFTGVTQSPVYVRIAYDEKGDYDGFSGPPPPGTPLGQYSTDGKTIAPVTPGPGAKIKVVFDDSVRHP